MFRTLTCKRLARVRLRAAAAVLTLTAAGMGMSIQSALASNDPPSGGGYPPPRPSPPAAPTLRVTELTCWRTVLVWTDHATNEDGFRVYRKRQAPGSTWELLATFPPLNGVGATLSYGVGSGSATANCFEWKVCSFRNGAVIAPASNVVPACADCNP